MNIELYGIHIASRVRGIARGPMDYKQLRKHVEKCIRIIEQQKINGQMQTRNLISIATVRFNLLSHILFFIKEC
jgi:hypothetical protein